MDTLTMHLEVKQELDKTSALELPAFEPEEFDLWLNKTIRKFAKTRSGGNNPKGTSFEQTQKRIDDLRTLVKSYIELAMDDEGQTGFESIPYSYSTPLPVQNSGVGDEDYWFTLHEECVIWLIENDIPALVKAGITECTWDEYRAKVDDPYSEHHLHYDKAKPLRLIKDDKVYLVSDSHYTITSYFLTYIKKPQVVSYIDVATTTIAEGITYGVYSTNPAAYVTYNAGTYYTGDTFVGVSGVTTYTETPGTSCTVNTACDLPEHTHDEIVKMTASSMLENIEQPRYQSHMNEVASME